MLSDLYADVRFTLRTFAKRPAFTGIAVLSLALGIGAATAVFSIVSAVLLRPLPYRDPGRLAAIWMTSTREQSLPKLFASYADYVEYRRHSRTLESVAAATWAVNTGRILTGHGPAQPVLTIPATASFFDTLGATAAVGRTFLTEDESRGCSLVLAYRFWSSTLGADRSITGKNLKLDDKPCIVLGVMPEQFAFYPTQTQAWVLLGPGFQRDQDHLNVGIFARLKPGVTLKQVQTEVYGLFRALHTDPRTKDFEPAVFDLHGEFTFLAGRTLRTTLILVFSAVLLLLLTACLNVANLLLAQLSDRDREMAVRAALGSGQSRLIRQVLAEGLLLAAGGAVIGLGLAWAAIRYFRLANPIELSVGADVKLNLPVLAFSVALSIGATLVFALLPAFRASKVDLIRHLKTGGRGSIQTRQSLAKAVLAVEMAFSFVLLIGAGLFITSALRMGSEHLGFDPDHILAARVALPQTHFPGDAQRRHAYDQLLANLHTVPGIAGIALSSKLPPEAGGNQILEIQGRPVAEGHEVHDVGADAVSPDFFNVMRIAVRSGRTFTIRDRENSLPVAIVNEALAAKYFPGTDPIGQLIRIPGGAMPWLTVIGVVGNLKHTELMNEMTWVETPIFYRPLNQEPRPFVQLAARVAGSVGSIAPEIRRDAMAVDPALSISDVEPLRARLSKTLAYPRFRAGVFLFFSLGALLLSAAGLHGVLSQFVSRRIPEFGLRRAVGAQARHLLLLIARQGGAPVLAGLAAGILLTIAFSRLFAALLYGIRPADPATLAIVSIAMLGVAAIAIAWPAIRAARVDPMTALRDE